MQERYAARIAEQPDLSAQRSGFYDYGTDGGRQRWVGDAADVCAARRNRDIPFLFKR